MGSWFLAKKQDTQQTQPMTALRVQSSVQGKPHPLLWGRNRLAGNLIWYGDFTSVQVNTGQGSSGGKGGVTGGGGKGQQGSISYTYNVSAALGLCEGPIVEVLTVWANKAIATATGRVGAGGAGQNLGFEVFIGDYSQTAWGYLASLHPGEALNYRGLAYVAQAGIDLGSTTELSNYSFEVTGGISNAAAGIPDANPRDVVVDYLTNPHYGVPGWPAGRLASMAQYAAYCQASGLLVSPVETDSREAAAFLADLFTATNSSPRWSSGKLDVIPWGDSQISGNGVTYFPQVTPLYDLTNDDFLPMSSGGSGDQPIRSVRKAPNERLNVIRIEYLNRSNNYDPDVVDDKDQASIQQYGERPSDVRHAHFFCLTDAARLSAHLQLGRQQIPNTYEFMLPSKFILPDVEDIVTLTRAESVLFRQPVRITEIKENDDGSLTFTAEEYLGTAGAPLYGVQATAGFTPNTNVDPGGINDPILFEPTDELGGGLQVWAAVCGLNHALWGGCNVFASYDGVTYQFVDRISGPSRMGVLSSALAAFPVNPIGPTIDITNTLQVDLTQSSGQLLSGTQLDAQSLNTACYVDGEIIAYQTATLTGTSKYNLNYLVRDSFGTESRNVLHPAGSKFARLDSQILQVPFDQTRIGATISLKFQSFNVWGGGLQDISTLPVYTYVLTGSALASPLPPVTNVRTVFEAGFTKIWWEEVEDFRQGIRYIIRKGDTFGGGQDLGILAHPPFIAFGAGIYWIMPTCQPLANLIVFGETPQSITIAGNMLTENIVQTTNFQALGWPGIYDHVDKEGVDPTAFLRLVGAASVLADPDILANPDVLNSGIIATSGSYIADPLTCSLNVGYVADCFVNITWTSAGIHLGENVLADPDFLNSPDVLGSSGGAFVEVWIEVRWATTATGDMFGPADMFGPDVPDWFNSGIQWNEWQRYVPGVYRAQYLEYRVVFSTLDPTIVAYLTSMVAQVSIPARIDHYIGNSVGTGGLTIVFEPDDASVAKPFNGGPLVGGVGNHPLPAVQMDWPGHAAVNFVIDAISLAQMTFHFEDATGTHVAVSGVDTIVEGY